MVSSMEGVLIRTSVAMIKYDGQKNRDERFISSYTLQFIVQESQGRNSR